MREKDIEKKLREAVNSMGGRAYKFVSPGNAGVPDRIICMPGGHIYFAEIKTDDGKLTPIQKAQIRYLENLGQDVRVLYGLGDVEQFIMELENLDKGDGALCGLRDVEKLIGRLRIDAIPAT